MLVEYSTPYRIVDGQNKTLLSPFYDTRSKIEVRIQCKNALNFKVVTDCKKRCFFIFCPRGL